MGKPLPRYLWCKLFQWIWHECAFILHLNAQAIPPQVTASPFVSALSPLPTLSVDGFTGAFPEIRQPLGLEDQGSVSQF